MSYNSKYKGAEVESLLDKVNDMGEIPTKVSQLENDVPYVTEDVVSDGVYAVDTNGNLIDYNSADATATGVALVAGEHKFMIAKNDATNDGSNYNLCWTNNTSDLSLTNYSNADGTNSYGYLPKPDGTFGGSTHLSDDFTTWTNGALSDFNGKDNTEVIAAASSHAKDMCTVLNTFNQTEQTAGRSADWYVPACGQLAFMYLNMTEINAALAKIGGTALAAKGYWSSSEKSSFYAWGVSFGSGGVIGSSKGHYDGVRFVRDISTPKPLNERVSELESSKQDMIEDLDDIRDGASKGATALQEEQYKGTVTSVTAGEGLAGGTITGSGTISLEKRFANVTDVDLLNKVDILKIGNTVNDTNLTIKDASSVWVEMLSFDKFGRYDGGIGYYKFPKEVTFGEATTSLKGLMSASDKAKLDGIDLTGKQDKLVSGTNIKTINGESILGSGNIVISGGGSSSGDSGAYAEVSHGTGDTTFALSPNTFHVWDEVASLDLSFADETAGVANEYLFQFASGTTATTLTLPDGLKWANDTAPTIAENMIYQVSVLKGLASVLEFNKTSLISFNVAYGGKNNTYTAEEGMTWGQWVESSYNFEGAIVTANGKILFGSFLLNDVTKDDAIVSNYVYTTLYYD